jgi:hypothetical protein
MHIRRVVKVSGAIIVLAAVSGVETAERVYGWCKDTVGELEDTSEGWCACQIVRLEVVSVLES